MQFLFSSVFYRIWSKQSSMSDQTNSAHPESRAVNETQADSSESTGKVHHEILSMKKIGTLFLDSNSADVFLIAQGLVFCFIL